MTKNKTVIRAKRNTIKFPYYQDCWTNASLPFTNYCSLTTNNTTMKILQLWCSLLKGDEACAVQTTRAVLAKPPGRRHLQKQPWITPVPAAPGSLKHRLWGERWSRDGIPWAGSKRRNYWQGCLYGLQCARSLRYLENKTVMNRCSEHRSGQHANHWGFHASHTAHRVFNQKVSN